MERSIGRRCRRPVPITMRVARYEAPAGPAEEALAAIWQTLLRLERVSRRDNFFELGGHSPLIVQMIDRLCAIGFATDMRRVFESATLADLAA